MSEFTAIIPGIKVAFPVGPGNITPTVPGGKLLLGITLIEPLHDVDFSVGLTGGGNELFGPLLMPASAGSYIGIGKFFPVAAKIYFSGVFATTKYILYWL